MIKKFDLSLPSLDAVNHVAQQFLDNLDLMFSGRHVLDLASGFG